MIDPCGKAVRRTADKRYYRGLERFDTMGSALERHVEGQGGLAVQEKARGLAAARRSARTPDAPTSRNLV